MFPVVFTNVSLSNQSQMKIKIPQKSSWGYSFGGNLG
jgi:hypothetical protein